MKRIFVTIILAVLTAQPASSEIKIQEVTSPLGIKAWLVEDHSIPFIALNIGFSGGTSFDSAETSGAVNLMTGLLEEGTGTMDAVAFLRARERLAANFGFSAGRDEINITATVLSENADEALKLLKAALVDPSFNQAAIERVKTQILASIRSATTDPDEIAQAALSERAFAGHPYGRTKRGTVETVTALDIDDIGDAHLGALTRDRMFVGVVGDIAASDLGVMLDNLLGELPEVGADMPQKTTFAAAGGLQVVEFDTPQSVAVFAQPGVGRHHPDFFAAFVMNHILGGSGFSSRLTQEVREKRGLTYGVYSYLAPMDLAHFIGGGVASGNDRIKEAIDVIKAQWRLMAADGVSEDELEAAQKYLTGAYPLRFDGNARIADILVGMQLQHLPTSYITSRNDRIMSVTLQDIKRVAQWLLRPEDLAIVVVGKPTGLSSDVD